MHLLDIVEAQRTFIEWSVKLEAFPQDADSWRALFESWIPEWTNSLKKALARNAR